MLPPHPAPGSHRPDPAVFERALDRAPVSVALEVDVAAPAEEVWARLVAVNRWPIWHPGIDFAVLRAPSPAPGARLDWRGDGLRIRSVVTEALPPGQEEEARLEWTLSTLGGHGAQRWTLGTGEGVTRVCLEEWWRGFSPWLLRRTLQRTLDVARPAWLLRLRDEAERPRTRPPP